jgi:hypothetical protein
MERSVAVSRRKPGASLLATALTAVGFLSFLLGLYFAVYQGWIEPGLNGHMFAAQDMSELAFGAILSLLSLILIAASRAVRLLQAIRDNLKSGPSTRPAAR